MAKMAKRFNNSPKTSKFDGKTFESLADDLKSGRLPLPRVTLSDDVQTGLRAIIRNTGLISFHVQYQSGDARPYLKIGDYPDMSLTRARHVAATVIKLADRGIDVQEGLHTRLIREIEEKGEKWKP